MTHSLSWRIGRFAAAIRPGYPLGFVTISIIA